MKSQLWQLALVTFSFLLPEILAGRLSDVARRGGYTEAMVKNLQRSRLDARATNSSGYQFYNNITKGEPSLKEI